MRVFAKLQFKGTHYHGWQIQENANSIQEELQKSLETLIGKNTPITGCGRTDTGVHASEFYAHFDIEAIPTNFLNRWNGILSNDIAVSNILSAPEHFSARFDAKYRTYGYYMHKLKDPFKNEISWYQTQDFDFEKMQKAASLLLKHENFKSFCKLKSDNKTHNCKIIEAKFIVTEKGSKFKIEANRFLRGMVRAIVGTLIQVGKGSIDVAQFERIIRQQNRSKAGPSVPAHGLFLEKIKYPTGKLKKIG